MMSYFLIAVLIVGVIGGLVYCMGQAMDGDIRFGIATVAIIIFILTFIIKWSTEEEEQGPCLKKETSLAWNAATKTMMPYTSCTERGTWTK